MNWFKRLCLFVFGLSGILALAALSLVWVGPWTSQARTLIAENTYYFWALEALVCIAAAGLLLCLLMSLFAPRNPKQTIVASVAGGEITVTRAAIASQVQHVIEADGTCTASSVKVRVRKRGHVRVHAKVTPHLPVDVVKRGEVLYSELQQGLAKVCGDSVKSIDIVFTEPEQRGSLSTYVDDAPAAEPASSQAEQTITVPMAPRDPEPEPAPEPAPAPEPQEELLVEADGEDQIEPETEPMTEDTQEIQTEEV